MTNTTTSDKLVLIVEVYSEVWGWDIDSIFYSGTTEYAHKLTFGVVADHIEEAKGKGYMTEGQRDGSKRYTIRPL
jgi:hypothetical protein